MTKDVMAGAAKLAWDVLPGGGGGGGGPKQHGMFCPGWQIFV